MARYRVYIDANGKIIRKNVDGKGDISGLYVYDKSTVAWSVQFYELSLSSSEYETIDLSGMQSLRLNVRAALDDDSELLAFQHEFNQGVSADFEDLSKGYVTWEIVFNNSTLETMLDDAQGSVDLCFEITAITLDGSRQTLDQGTLTVFPSLDDGGLGDPPETPGYYMTGEEVASLVDTKVAEFVDSAPETLDTLNELAAALGDDPNFATTVTNELAGKAETDHTHEMSDVSSLQSALGDLDDMIMGVVDSLTDYSLTTHTHTIADIEDLQTELSDLSDGISNISNSMISLSASVAENAPLEHTHAIEDVPELQAAIDAKQEKPEVYQCSSECDLLAEYDGSWIDIGFMPIHVQQNATVAIEIGFSAWINSVDAANASVQFEAGVTVNGELSTAEEILYVSIPAWERRLLRKVAEDTWIISGTTAVVE